jgi:ATP-dependent DNA helicase RecG
MAPTEVLAEQHYESFKKFFDSFNIEVCLLSGSLKKKEKGMALEKIASGQAKMIIGTHALIQSNVKFCNLGLVITDEQHRFGVRQRTLLSEKGNDPHIIVMTATPIPRTLAIILYGDLDISIIDELPPGRQKIDTRAVNSTYNHRIYTFIRKHLDAGHQAYIVCPMIEESDVIEAKAVMTLVDEIADTEFRNYSVGILHGKMKNDEKNRIMSEFVKGKIQVLVSTTVIEVGINVPNATIMLIENAERFGLSQLHQLRGRVGRGKDASYCILVTDSKGKVTKERMKIMQKTNDGFEIAETDLKLRGPGEFFGTMQHGLPQLKIANLYKDAEILKESQSAARLLLDEDRELKEDENVMLAERIAKMFSSAENIGI